MSFFFGKDKVLLSVLEIVSRIEHALTRGIKQIGEDLCEIRELLRKPPIPKGKNRFVFSKVRDKNGNYVEGDINKMKMNFGQFTDVSASPIDANKQPAAIEAGSAKFSLQAQDAQGNDVSGQYLVTVDPANELGARVQHDGTKTPSTALLTLNADGDPTAGPDDVAPITGTLAIIVGEPNAVGFDITATAGADPAPVV